MNYQKIYDELIKKCAIRGWSKKSAPCYTEKHHIKPKCLGGDNSPSNLVVLTAREHYVAHLLLAKIHGGKLWLAANIMRIGEYRDRFNSSMYEVLKVKFSESQKGDLNHMYGRKLSQETRDKIGKSSKGRVFSDAHKSRISESNKGKIFTTEHRLNISKSRVGKFKGVDNANYGKVGIESSHFMGYYHTPFGVFESIALAAKGCNCDNKTIRYRVKQDSFPDYWFDNVTGAGLSEKHKTAIKNSQLGILSKSFMGYYHTPLGVFESSRLAGVGNNTSQTTIRDRIKNPNFPDYWFEPKDKK